MAPLPPDFRFERLERRHDRETFDCHVDELNVYLQRQAMQDMRKRISVTFVLVDRAQGERLAGFYTLAGTTVKLEELPVGVTKRLPRYPLIPAILLGRLAVDIIYQGQGLGKMLLLNAFERCLKQEIPALLIIVEAKDESAVSFYGHQGFIPLMDQAQRLFLPIATVAKLFE